MLDYNAALNALSQLETEMFTLQETERSLESLKQSQRQLQIDVQDLVRQRTDSSKALEKKLSNVAASRQKDLAAVDAKYDEKIASSSNPLPKGE